MDKITFIIPVRDREKQRIQNCVDSLDSTITEEIIIVDYGSKEPIKDIVGARIIRYDNNPVWNKSHAINIGIRAASSKYVGIVDCDMIISPWFMMTVEKHLADDVFLYTTNVRRVDLDKIYYDNEDVDNWRLVNFHFTYEESYPWFEKKRRSSIHNANGGIQIYPNRWACMIGGADESLIYWGGMDNDMLERATMNGLVTINLNQVILHQEHENKKEKHLSGNEKKAAILVKMLKLEYLDEMIIKNIIIRNDGHWGEKEPNQSRFMKTVEEIEKEEEETKRQEEEYQKCFLQAVKDGKKSFMFNGREIKIYG